MILDSQKCFYFVTLLLTIQKMHLSKNTTIEYIVSSKRVMFLFLNPDQYKKILHLCTAALFTPNCFNFLSFPFSLDCYLLPLAQYLHLSPTKAFGVVIVFVLSVCTLVKHFLTGVVGTLIITYLVIVSFCLRSVNVQIHRYTYKNVFPDF